MHYQYIFIANTPVPDIAFCLVPGFSTSYLSVNDP